MTGYDDFEYANGADGTCQECGEPTDEDWHAYCADCFAEQNGWRRSSRAALEYQHEERETAVRLRLLERVAELERHVERLAGQNSALLEHVASLQRRLEALELPGPFREAA